MLNKLKGYLLSSRLKGLRRGPVSLLKKVGGYDLALRIISPGPPKSRVNPVVAQLRLLQQEQRQNTHEILNALYRMHPVEIKHNLKVITSAPIASDSLDHTMPSGTIQDNTCKPRFVIACDRFMKRKHSYLDLGCSGGGLVRNFLERKNFAIGIEGSNHSQLEGRAEWARIPNHLFTADITQEFIVKDGKKKGNFQFDIIGAWEVMEHLPEELLPGFCRNVVRHLAPGGIFVASVAMFPLPHHICLHEEAWWIKTFAANGLEKIDHSNIFTIADFPRGGPGDWPPGPNQGFHIVCRKTASRKG